MSQVCGCDFAPKSIMMRKNAHIQIRSGKVCISESSHRLLDVDKFVTVSGGNIQTDNILIFTHSDKWILLVFISAHVSAPNDEYIFIHNYYRFLPSKTFFRLVLRRKVISFIIAMQQILFFQRSSSFCATLSQGQRMLTRPMHHFKSEDQCENNARERKNGN